MLLDGCKQGDDECSDDDSCRGHFVGAELVRLMNRKRTEIKYFRSVVFIADED
jgi:hypothetical protein